ncbi:MAG: hypothetical protein Q9164_005706, partial [Protoblastenia rupestris]
NSFDEIVRITVGSTTKKTFKIHKDLLCNVSSFFRAALRGGFKEACDQSIDLLEDDPDTFERSQLWLYSRELRDASETTKDVKWTVLVRVFLFGEARGIPELQNAAIDLFLDKYVIQNEIPTTLLNMIYGSTRDDSPLRRLMVDTMAHRADLSQQGSRGWFAEGRRARFPSSFMFDIAIELHKVLVGRRQIITDFEKVRSVYHVTVPGVGKSCDQDQAVEEEEVGPT